MSEDLAPLVFDCHFPGEVIESVRSSFLVQDMFCQ